MKSSKGKNPQARRGGIFCEACKETLTVTIVFNIHNSCILTYHDIVYILICIYFIFNTFLRLKFFFLKFQFFEGHWVIGCYYCHVLPSLNKVTMYLSIYLSI